MAEDYKATIAMTCTNNNNLKYGDTFYCLAKYQLIWQYTYVMVSLGFQIMELYLIQSSYYASRSIWSVLIFLNLVSYYKDIYHDKATAFFCEYLLKCAFPCDLLGMWICYIYLWYTNARQTAKLLWCFLDSVLKGGVWNSNKNKSTLLKQMNPDVGYRTFFGYLELSITIFD